MAIVNINGTFIGASLKKSEFDGKQSFSVALDIYQPESPASDKMATIKVEDVDLLSTFNKDFAMGDAIEIQATVSGYQNKVYYKYVKLVS